MWVIPGAAKRGLGCCTQACGVGTVGTTHLLLAFLWKVPQGYYLLLFASSGCCAESRFGMWWVDVKIFIESWIIHKGWFSGLGIWQWPKTNCFVKDKISHTMLHNFKSTRH